MNSESKQREGATYETVESGLSLDKIRNVVLNFCYSFLNRNHVLQQPLLFPLA